MAASLGQLSKKGLSQPHTPLVASQTPTPSREAQALKAGPRTGERTAAGSWPGLGDGPAPVPASWAFGQVLRAWETATPGSLGEPVLCKRTRRAPLKHLWPGGGEVGLSPHSSSPPGPLSHHWELWTPSLGTPTPGEETAHCGPALCRSRLLHFLPGGESAAPRHCVGPSLPPGPAAQGGVLSIRMGSGVGGVHPGPPL